MASIPEDVLKARRVVEESREADATSQGRWEYLQAEVLSLSSAGFDDFQTYQQAVEEYLKDLPLAYHKPIREKVEFERADFLERQRLALMEKERANRCQYFDVAENNVILPKSDAGIVGFFSKWADRMQGDQLVTIVDTNRNGVPDSGDTGIDRDGRYHRNIQLSQGTSYPHRAGGGTCEVPLPWMGQDGGTDTAFDVRHLTSDSPEHLAMYLATNSAEYADGIEKQASDMADSVTDNPGLAGAIVGLSIAAYICPYTRPFMQVAMMTGGVVGEGYLVYDRVAGIRDLAEGKNDPHRMAKHDLEAFLAIAGAAPELKGITVAEFLEAPVSAARSVGEWLAGISTTGGMSGGPVLVGATGGGGSIGIAGVGALEGGLIAEGSAAGVAGRDVSALAIMAADGAGVSLGIDRPKNSYNLAIDESFSPRRGWDGTEAADAAELIELHMMEAGQPVEEIAQLHKHVDALREIYMRTPDENIRTNITKALQDVLADIEAARASGVPYESAASPVRRGFFDKFDKIIGETAYANDGRPFVQWRNARGLRPQESLKVPDGVELAGGVEKSISGRGNEGPRAALEQAFKAFGRRTGDGKVSGDIRQVGGKVSEFRVDKGPGYRIYFAESGSNGSKRVTVLRVGDKGSQQPDIDYSIRKAWELGLTSIFVYVVGENVDL